VSGDPAASISRGASLIADAQTEGETPALVATDATSAEDDPYDGDTPFVPVAAGPVPRPGKYLVLQSQSGLSPSHGVGDPVFRPPRPQG
jgi:hypothetical protein